MKIIHFVLRFAPLLLLLLLVGIVVPHSSFGEAVEVLMKLKGHDEGQLLLWTAVIRPDIDTLTLKLRH